MNYKDVVDLSRKAEIIFKSEYPNINVNIRWDFNWLAKKTYGQCCYRGQNSYLIKISQYHWMNSAKEGIWNTIVHELCHAYDTHHSGHGYFWRQIAHHMSAVCHTDIKRVGGAAESKITLGEVEGMKPVAKFTCPNCGMVHYVFRRGGAYKRNGVGYTCGRCHTLLNFEKLR